jgi:hypothetical protein
MVIDLVTAIILNIGFRVCKWTGVPEKRVQSFAFYMGDAQPKSAEKGVGWGETPHASSSHGIGGLGESEGERCLCITICILMFLFKCISSIGVVDSAFSADTVLPRFEPRSSEYVKTPNNYAFYVSNLFLSWLSNITISFSITLLLRNYSEVEGRRKRWTIASNWVYWSFLNMRGNHS